ncbi:hypothetical protein STSP2_01132 [Anaerohalosphaera lusitana]|uniref:Uncharacterized protein n=1 Tax=Anaerohalosphaera lusitana TaxID=1936003 RepID=A0A1U9NJR2_9BACT|nr:hypothetical protein [Anaerohalosphaera lusitana]AQT67978.1 hypothetical protein STSP2_01132 [Anaerohalosphaera lusitana]
MKLLKIYLMAAMCIAVGLAVQGCQGEEPEEAGAETYQQEEQMQQEEQQQQQREQEQMEREGMPGGMGEEQTQITRSDLANAIESYVREQSQDQDGYMMVTDEVTGEQLKLKLDSVHRDRIAQLNENTYFTCADFETPDGKMYDLDIFMTGQSPDDLEFATVTIHKEAGQERYTWEEEQGMWQMAPVGDTPVPQEAQQKIQQLQEQQQEQQMLQQKEGQSEKHEHPGSGDSGASHEHPGG